MMTPLLVTLLTTLSLAVPAGQASAGEPQCRGESATHVGTPGDDTIVGTSGRDVIVGLAGDDTLEGVGGGDLLCGNGGADVLNGGRGGDRVYAGAGDDDVRDLLTGGTEQALVGGRGDDSLAFSWRVVQGGEVVFVDALTDFSTRLATLGDTGVSFPIGSFRTVRALFSEGTWSVVGTSRGDVYRTHRYLSVDAATRGGRDVVRGSWHDDRIDGGAGRDTAYADRGRDVCRSVERGPLEQCENL